MIVTTVGTVAPGVASGIVAASLTHDVGRSAVIGLAGVVVIASARWVWKAILRQMRAEIQAAAQPNTDALEQAIVAKIGELSLRNDEQHRETADRLGSIEQRFAVVEANTEIHATRLDHGAARMQDLREALDTLAADVARLRTPSPSLPPKDSAA